MTLIALPPSQELANIVGSLGGRWHGRIAMARCPAHADTTPSLSLRQGDKGILVTCFAGCLRGDVLRALSAVATGKDFQLPSDGGPTRRGNARRLWDDALELSGTLGERYLVRRGLRGPLSDIRFHPRCPLGPKPRTVFRPALLVCVREGPNFVAVQRIFLDPTTAHCTSKVMLGTPGRGSWQGGGGGVTLAVAEGFETAAAYTRLHGIPCWAALGARRLGQLQIPPMVQTLLLAGDNDAEGWRAVREASQAHHRPDLTIKPAFPPSQFNDWADVLKSEAG